MNPYGMNNINHITVPKIEFNEKMAELYMLKNTVERQESIIANLMKENKDLKKQLKITEEEKKAKEQEMKKKFLELHTEQKKVNSELGKYEAIPEFKGILDLYAELLDFRNELSTVLRNNAVYQEKCKLDKKIEEFKQKNKELESELKKNGKAVSVKTRANELQQAELELKTMKEKSQMIYMANKSKVNDMTNKMKESTTKLVGTITNALGEVKKHLQAHRMEIKNIRKSVNEFPEKPVYDKIMNILLEHQNSLMKDMLGHSISAMSLNSASSTRDDESLYNSDSDYDIIDEDDIVSIQGDTKTYKFIMHNVKEEWVDGLQDIEKVKAILKTFTTLSTSNINVERMGKVTPGKTRPLKISLPTFQQVQIILKTKQKLRTTCYAEVKISSFKKRTGPSNMKPNNLKKKMNPKGNSVPSFMNLMDDNCDNLFNPKKGKKN